MVIEFPIDELRKFHSKARQHIKLLEKAADRLESSGNVADFEERFSDIFNFVEKELPLHIDDEEHCLFPVMRRYVPEGADQATNESIADILNDHKDVTAAVDVIKLMKKVLGGEKRTDKAYIRDVAAKARGIADLMNDHFLKEERTVFRIAEDSFTEKQMNEVAMRMKEIRKRQPMLHG